jgi:hypothetical protein
MWLALVIVAMQLVGIVLLLIAVRSFGAYTDALVKAANTNLIARDTIIAAMNELVAYTARHAGVDLLPTLPHPAAHTSEEEVA